MRDSDYCVSCNRRFANRQQERALEDSANGEIQLAPWVTEKSVLPVVQEHLDKISYYAQALPQRLGTLHLQTLNNPELLNLQEEVALIQVRLIELMRRLDSGESGETWRKLVKAKESFSHHVAIANITGDQKESDRANAALETMVQLIDDGAKDQATWDEIGEMVQLSAKLKRAEHDRLLAARVYISLGEVGSLMELTSKSIQVVVEREISDPETRSRVLLGVAEALESVMQTDEVMAVQKRMHE